MPVITKKHISKYGLKKVGNTYFDSVPGKPKEAKYYIEAQYVDEKGFFLSKHLKLI